MPRPGLKLKKVLHPTPKSKVWLDVLMMVIFGTWFFGGIFEVIFFSKAPASVEEACSGPGFVDFGCTGGWEAIVANVIGTLGILFIFSVFLIALLRLINRGG